jgi:Na+/phosphate symporter
MQPETLDWIQMLTGLGGGLALLLFGMQQMGEALKAALYLEQKDRTALAPH